MVALRKVCERVTIAQLQLLCLSTCWARKGGLALKRRHFLTQNAFVCVAKHMKFFYNEWNKKDNVVYFFQTSTVSNDKPFLSSKIASLLRRLEKNLHLTHSIPLFPMIYDKHESHIRRCMMTSCLCLCYSLSRVGHEIGLKWNTLFNHFFACDLTLRASNSVSFKLNFCWID